MKLQQLQEAKTKYGTSGAKLAYVEMIDDRFGDAITKKAVTSTTDLEMLYKAKDRDDFDDILDKNGLGNLWGMSEVLHYSWKEMKKSVQQTGSWSTEFEDGSVALSAKGPKHAKQLANMEFVKAFAQDDDGDDEDWF